jgi:hypothetical protein
MITMKQQAEIADTLKVMGVRVAAADERGWYVTVLTEGQLVRLWVTDDENEDLGPEAWS